MRARSFRSLLYRRVATFFNCHPRLGCALSSSGKPDLGVATQREQILFASKAVTQPPQLTARWRDFEVQPARVETT
jgi:hypothetical protein